MNTNFSKTHVASPEWKQGFVAGAIGGALMVLATVLLRLTISTSTLTEMAADWFTSVLPGTALDFLLEALSFSAKPLMFASLLILQIIIGGILGIAYARLSEQRLLDEINGRIRGIGFALILWLIGAIALVPLFGGGVLASDAPGSQSAFLLISLVPFLIYGLSLAYLLDDTALVAIHKERRSALRKLGGWAILGTLAFLGTNFLFGRLQFGLTPSGSFRNQGILSTEITPNDEFYVVSKNIIDPVVKVEDWQLKIGGLVEAPYVLTYDELRAMPFVEEFVTLECISNPVGGDLISNALWKGVPLKAILERAGKLGDNVVDISFQATDSYTENISLEKATQEKVIVAYEMNGEPLPDKHGFPARLIVPGFFGIKHVKWITAIEPVDKDVIGYWQERGWVDIPYVKTFSRIDIPENHSDIFDDTVQVGGVAFAGNRGISNVEISDDEGQTWTSVDEISEPLSPYTWVIWKATYTAKEKGRIFLRVRATDGDGVVQTDEFRDSLPDGASGHQQIIVNFLERPAESS